MSDMDNRGIDISYTKNKLITWVENEGGTTGNISEMIDFLMDTTNNSDGMSWLLITPDGLGNGYATPTQVIKNLFTGRSGHAMGSRSGDVTSRGYGRVFYGTDDARRMAGLTDYNDPSATYTITGHSSHFGHGVSLNRNQVLSVFLSNMNTCYSVRATLAYLPPVAAGDDDVDLYGFFSWKSGYKMTYDFDVFAALQDARKDTDLLVLFNGNGSDPRALTSANWHDVTGHSITPEYSYWPPHKTGETLSTQNAAWKRSQKSIPYDFSDTAIASSRNYSATTFTLEAVGIDYMDSLIGNTGDADLLSNSTFEDIEELVDPNYLMHSNQVWAEGSLQRKEWAFRVDAPYFDDDGATYVSPLVDLSTSGRQVHLYKMRFCARDTKRGFLSYDNSSVYDGRYQMFMYENPPPSEKWEPWFSRYGSHNWEMKCFGKARDMMCEKIQAELDVQEYPKKLLNKVQKRGKIRDEQISAFGYISPDAEAYKLYLAQGGSAQPVTIDYTGEVYNAPDRALSEDARVGANEAGTYWGAEGDMTWEEYSFSRFLEETLEGSSVVIDPGIS